MSTIVAKSLKKATFPVLGMSCAACAGSVESLLAATPGITLASVNYANASVLIEFDPQITAPKAFQTTLQAMGYDIVVSEEPSEATHIAEDLQALALKSLQTRMLLSVALSVPLVVIGMAFMHWHPGNWVMWALSTPIVFLFGRQFFIHAWQQARHGRANMDTLVALSTSVAYFFSVFNTLNPDFWVRRGLEPHVYFEAAGVIIAFLLIGKYLEEKAKSGTSTAIKKLVGLQPKTVFRLSADGQAIEIPIAQVQIGDRLRVRPGDRVPADGTLFAGKSFVDESMISGESIPVEKVYGSSVLAGTMNQSGSFDLLATKVGQETVLAQMIQMVQQAQGSKAPVQRLVDKVSSIFVPSVMAIAVLSAAIWLLVGGENSVTHAILAMITVLVVACPCALGLATPTALTVGIGKAAENGILIQDAEGLERAHQVNALILDKTGTVTEGRPVVTDSQWILSTTEENIAAHLLYSMEARSEHPLARAICQHLSTDVGAEFEFDNFESLAGMGAKAVFKGQSWYVGNVGLLKSVGIAIPLELALLQETWEQDAKTVVFFADTRSVVAILAIADKVKATSVEAIRQLEKGGIAVYMLTGDNQKTASAVAKQLGIAHFRAGAMPEDKAKFVQELQAQGKVVAMVGDGINDSQALAQADVSIAMGHGSDIAMDVAKMTIVSSDLLKLPLAIGISRQTVRTIRQNLFWAFVYNVIGIPIAAGILFPVNGFLLNPMIAGGAMALSSVSVVTNSLRLKWQKFR